MNILAVHFGHNATVALVQAGTLVFAMSEERFNRLKNSNGMPVMALDYVYKNLIKPEQIDYAVVTQTDLAGYLDIKKRGFGSFRNYDSSNVNFGRRYNFVKHFLSKVPGFFAVRSWIGRRLFWLKQKLNTKKAWDYYAESIKLPKEKILACNHHAAHAYSCCFNLDPKRKTLIFTMDGEGDGLSSTVNIYENYKLDTVSKNPTRVSLGYFFTEVTKLLGMIPNEHEFKVMGLAPYAKQEKARKLRFRYQKVL